MPKRWLPSVPGAPLLPLLQAMVTAVLLAGLLVCRFWAPKIYSVAEQIYAGQLESRQLERPLVRFASAAWDALALPAAAEKAAPAGASNKTYMPKGIYQPPISGASLSSGYGWRTHPVTHQNTFHNGVDLACAEGTPVMAAADGTVEYTRYRASGGNSLRLRHAGGVETAYCHMQYIFVRTGEQISAGQLLGTAGSTGNATGPHLHFSLLYNDIYYDPSKMLGLT